MWVDPSTRFYIRKMKRTVYFRPPAGLTIGEVPEDKGKLIPWGTAVTTFTFNTCMFVTDVPLAALAEGEVYVPKEGYLPEGPSAAKVPHVEGEHGVYYPLYFPELDVYAVWINPAIGSKVTHKIRGKVRGVLVIATDEDAERGLPTTIHLR